MAISTFAELKTAVANWLSRSDLTSRIPEFNTMAESWIAYGLEVGSLKVPPLRIRSMESSSTLTCVAGTATVSLPTRYLAMRNLYVDGTPVQKINPVTPEQRIFQRPSTDRGKPRFFSIEGENIVLAPIPDSAYSLPCLFYQRFASFSADADTNALLTGSPNVYLFGCLYAATTLIQNHPMGANWLAAFAGAIKSLNEADRSDRYSGGSLMMRSDTGSP
jgi:hypothetical protein